MYKIIAIIGARPQFIKHFTFEKACENRLHLKTIHTGQHYDSNMSDVFFRQLGMKKPNFLLSTGSGNHGLQTGKMMIDIEKIIIDEKPDGVVVYGDTNSTLAGSLVGSKLKIPVFHIEAGLRSYNREMPEEINRVLTDHISSLLFTPSNEGVTNLRKEGIVDNVYNVGDIMKDLVLNFERMNLIKNNNSIKTFYYASIHRPYNTDNPVRLREILETFNTLDKRILIALHPRTKNLMKNYNLAFNDYANIEFLDPQPYLENLALIKNCSCLFTDSGGMQKEAYWLQKKCVTIRKETEWIETLQDNSNTLVFDNLKINIPKALKNQAHSFDNSLYGDGKSSSKIVDIIRDYFN